MDWQFELFKIWCRHNDYDWMHGFERIDQNSWQNKVDGHIFTVTYN